MKSGKPIGLGIAGLGRAGWDAFIRELAPRAEKFRVTAVCDIDKARRDMAASQLGCAAYERVEDLAADPRVELVAVATRSCDHFRHAAIALKAGKHVFLEKPMTADYAEARRLQALERRSRGRLFVRHNSRYNPVYMEILRIVKSGMLGEVFEIKARWSRFSRRDDWQTMRRNAGGIMTNTGSHMVDQAIQLLGSPVKEIWCRLWKVAAVGDAEDHMRLMLVGANGRLADLEHSSGSAVCDDPDWTVLGTRGGLICRGAGITVRRLDPRKKLPPRKVMQGSPGKYYGTPEELPWIDETYNTDDRGWGGASAIWDDLHAAIRKGRKYPITVEQAVEVMRVLTEARKQTQFA